MMAWQAVNVCRFISGDHLDRATFHVVMYLYALAAWCEVLSGSWVSLLVAQQSLLLAMRFDAAHWIARIRWPLCVGSTLSWVVSYIIASASDCRYWTLTFHVNVMICCVCVIVVNYWAYRALSVHVNTAGVELHILNEMVAPMRYAVSR
jgi:hypothetical protein